LIKFNLFGMPPGTTVSKATLYLYLQARCDLGNRGHTVRVYRITQDWSSSSATWANQPSHDSGTVWALKSVSSRTWGWYTWDVTTLVNSWLNGTYPNYGIIWRGPESSGSDSAVLEFFASEAGGTTYDPRLEFSYTGSANTKEILGGESIWPVGETLSVLDLLGRLTDGSGSTSGAFEFRAEEMSLTE
jgi:hypothetical protein